MYRQRLQRECGCLAQGRMILTEQAQPLLQATLIQTLSALGVDTHLLGITTARYLDPHLDKGIRIAGQAMNALE